MTLKIKRILAFIILIMICVLSGCKANFLPTRAEIELFDTVVAVGIDKSSEDPAQVEVTFISLLKKGSGKESGGDSRIIIASDTGYTVFEAQRKIKANSTRKQFLGYVDYFLIGEEAAKENFHKYFDMIVRDHEVRFSSNVYIVKGGTAKELLYTTSTEDRFIADKLKSFKKNKDFLSDIEVVSIIKAANMFEDNFLVLPALRCKDFEGRKIISKMPEKDLCYCGYAVLKDNILAGYIDKEYSRGYNFLINEVGSCPVNVMDGSGKPVALEVLEAETKVEPRFNGDRLEEITFNTHLVANITEQHSLENIFTMSSTEKMASEMSNIIKSDMEKVIELSQGKKVDFIQLKQRLEMAHPYKLRKIKDDWDKIFPELKIKVEVEAHIMRSYDIQQPNGSKGVKD